MKATRPTGVSRVEQSGTSVDTFERLHVQVLKSQYKRLKDIAHAREVSLAEVIRDALSLYLKQPEQKKV